MICRGIAAPLLLVALAAPVQAQQSYENGVAAYERGDYAIALRILRTWAEQGDISARTFIVIMYDNGQAVTQDYGKAVKWYRMAVQQGNADAKTNLGNQYFQGRGVTQEPILLLIEHAARLRRSPRR